MRLPSFWGGANMHPQPETIYVIFSTDLATGCRQAWVGYESEKDAKDDLLGREDDEYIEFGIETMPYYAKVAKK